MPDLVIPKVQTTVRTINRFEINVRKIVLNTMAEIEILLYDGDSLLDMRVIEISGETYSNWGLDDNYLVTYVEAWIHANL